MSTKIYPLELLDKRQDAQARREGYRTFDGWKKLDRVVVKGQKATRFNSKGKALFHESQTAYPEDLYVGWTDTDDALAFCLTENDFLNG